MIDTGFGVYGIDRYVQGNTVLEALTALSRDPDYNLDLATPNSPKPYRKGAPPQRAIAEPAKEISQRPCVAFTRFGTQLSPITTGRRLIAWLSNTLSLCPRHKPTRRLKMSAD